MDLFVYGTLRSRVLMAAVAGAGPLESCEASLADHAVYAVAREVFPLIVPQRGAAADGLLWRGLTEAQMVRLDAYEGAFGYYLSSVEVMTVQGVCSAQVYLPRPAAFESAGAWSLDAWEAGHLAPAILAAQELFSRDPLPDHAGLRAIWPMTEARAWSKHRAQTTPAQVRRQAHAGDFVLRPATPPVGDFFAFQAFDADVRRFDGSCAPTARREGFWGIDAAIVLPYDRVRDRVLLVEQARLGPAMRRDPNPWMLEPVAGIVDARETPHEAALREAEEEAGLTDISLQDAGSFYVSPGASTDYFHTFVGLCDLPQDSAYSGGLASEDEDLRLHTLTFDAAMALADSGEIATGPALYLLHWLARHRARLRAGVS